MNEQPFLTVSGLSRYFSVQKAGFVNRKSALLKAVDNVDFVMQRGETLGVVGESGCGKSTVGRTVLRAYELTAGSVIFNFDGTVIDVSKASQKQLRDSGFRQKAQMIFQDPNSSLNPRFTILDIIGEPLKVAGHISQDQVRARVSYLMERVGLDQKYLKRYPHAFSGGQRQRISIARALAAKPSFIVADEPTSALDVSTQASILNLLMELRREFQLTSMFISHNLGVIRKITDRVAVMYLGRIVELADNQQLFAEPRHPYTVALLKSVPIANPKIRSGLEAAPGEIGNASNPPPGCHFHPRCPFCTDVCQKVAPQLQDVGGGHMVCCHHAETIPHQKQ